MFQFLQQNADIAIDLSLLLQVSNRQNHFEQLKKSQNSSQKYQNSNGKSVQREEEETKKKKKLSNQISHPSTNSPIDRKGSGEKFGKNIFSPPSPLPYAEQRLQRVEARQSGRTRKHSGRETSLNKSA